MPQPGAVSVIFTSIDMGTARGRRLDGEVVDEAEVDDVDRDLRIEAGLERGPDGLLAELARGRDRRFVRSAWRSVAGDCAGVLHGDAEEASRRCAR